MSYFSDNCVLEMPRGREPWGTRYEGKAAAREGLAGRFEGIPDVRYTDETHYADKSSQTGISTWTLTGTTNTRPLDTAMPSRPCEVGICSAIETMGTRKPPGQRELDVKAELHHV